MLVHAGTLEPLHRDKLLVQSTAPGARPYHSMDTHSAERGASCLGTCLEGQDPN